MVKVEYKRGKLVQQLSPKERRRWNLARTAYEHQKKDRKGDWKTEKIVMRRM